MEVSKPSVPSKISLRRTAGKTYGKIDQLYSNRCKMLAMTSYLHHWFCLSIC